MVALKDCFLLLSAGLAFLIATGQEPPPALAPRTALHVPLFHQSAIPILEREFSTPDISFLLLDAESGAVISSHWDDPEKPIPLGSLVKPFTALAYAEHHNFRYPTLLCRGEASGCWRKQPHGELGIVSATAQSCNSYFRSLAASLDGNDLLPIAERFSVEPPNAALTGAPLMGLGDRWRIAPMHMAQAYLELSRRRSQPGVRELFEGMAIASRTGTGAGVGAALLRGSALVKTGTAVCTHPRHAPGDGFVLALAPEEKPEFLLLVRVHSVPGAAASITVGKMLRRLQE